MNSERLQCALDEEKYLRANCLSVGYSSGLVEGFSLSLNKVTIDGRRYPPHLEVGDGFIARAKGDEGCLFTPTAKQGGLVRRAEILEVEPEGRKPFKVLARPEKERPETFLLHVSFCLPTDRKIREEVLDLRIRYGIFGNAEVVLKNGYEALVRFQADDEYIVVMFEDGTVRQVRRTYSGLVEEGLNPADMARARVNQFEHELEKLAEVEDEVVAIKRRDGILYGAISLLQITSKMEEARGVMIDFLTDQELTGPMRRKIREILAGFADAREFWFAENFQNLTIANHATTRNSTPPKQYLARKAARASADSELRNRMKGSSGGGNKGRKRASR